MSFDIMLGLFIFGSVSGYFIELLYRFYKHKYICNPGFLKGPYLPIYGIGLLILYLFPLITKINNELILSILATLVLVIHEYISGVIFIKFLNVRLWEYTNEVGNIHGIICVKFVLYWFFTSLIHYKCFYNKIVFLIEKCIKKVFFLKIFYYFFY